VDIHDLEKSVRKLSHLTKLVAVSAIVLSCHPDRAQAQQLYFIPDQPIQLSISGPGGTDTKTTTASSTLGTVTAVNISGASITITTGTGGSWLCASASGSTLTIQTGISAGCSTTQLSPNATYTGIINISGAGFSARTLQVNLTVSSSGGGTQGLVATP